jgi:hypothetical protein
MSVTMRLESTIDPDSFERDGDFRFHGCVNFSIFSCCSVTLAFNLTMETPQINGLLYSNVF